MKDNPYSERDVPATLPSDAREVVLGITFFDLSRMMEWSSNQEDKRVAAMLQEFYHLSVDYIHGAGGRIVKFIGDEGLAVFPREATEKVVLALADLSAEVHRRAAEHGFNTYLNTNVHVGSVIEGSFGPPGMERYDVLGKAVNIAARLGRRGLTLSQQAFRCLGPEAREKFGKIEQPTNYRYRG